MNLYKMSMRIKCCYEPELFPAMRLIEYNPLCVNLFPSGKIVILGIKTMDYSNIVNNVVKYISLHL